MRARRGAVPAALALAALLACPGTGGVLGTGTGAVQVAEAQEASGGGEVLDEHLGADRGILPVGLSEDDATYTTVARLAAADAALDNTLVSFVGEAVGEAVNAAADGYRWVVLQDRAAGSTSSIEVLMTDDQVSQIEHFGSYQMRGTTLRVTGIYRVADEAQTGNLDVTAYAVRVVDVGGPVEEPVDLRLLWVGLGLTVAGLALTVLNVYLKRRSRS